MQLWHLLHEERIWSRGIVNYKIMLIYIFPKKVKPTELEPRVNFTFMTEMMKYGNWWFLLILLLSGRHKTPASVLHSWVLKAPYSHKKRELSFPVHSCTLHFINPYNRFCLPDFVAVI